MIDWRALALAETHPLRVKLFELFSSSSEPLSPVMLARQLEEPVANVSFHVTRLRDAGLIELHSTRPRRGVVEHLYIAAGAGE